MWSLSVVYMRCACVWVTAFRAGSWMMARYKSQIQTRTEGADSLSFVGSQYILGWPPVSKQTQCPDARRVQADRKNNPQWPSDPLPANTREFACTFQYLWLGGGGFVLISKNFLGHMCVVYLTRTFWVQSLEGVSCPPFLYIYICVRGGCARVVLVGCFALLWALTICVAIDRAKDTAAIHYWADCFPYLRVRACVCVERKRD